MARRLGGRAWGNALGGYKTQKRVSGRFASSGSVGSNPLGVSAVKKTGKAGRRAEGHLRYLETKNKEMKRQKRNTVIRRTATVATVGAVAGATAYGIHTRSKMGLSPNTFGPAVRTAASQGSAQKLAGAAAGGGMAYGVLKNVRATSNEVRRAARSVRQTLDPATGINRTVADEGQAPRQLGGTPDIHTQIAIAQRNTYNPVRDFSPEPRSQMALPPGKSSMSAGAPPVLVKAQPSSGVNLKYNRADREPGWRPNMTGAKATKVTGKDWSGRHEFGGTREDTYNGGDWLHSMDWKTASKFDQRTIERINIGSGRAVPRATIPTTGTPVSLSSNVGDARFGTTDFNYHANTRVGQSEANYYRKRQLSDRSLGYTDGDRRNLARQQDNQRDNFIHTGMLDAKANKDLAGHEARAMRIGRKDSHEARVLLGNQGRNVVARSVKPELPADISQQQLDWLERYQSGQIPKSPAGDRALRRALEGKPFHLTSTTKGSTAGARVNQELARKFAGQPMEMSPAEAEVYKTKKQSRGKKNTEATTRYIKKYDDPRERANRARKSGIVR